MWVERRQELKSSGGGGGGKGLNNTRELLTGFHLLGASAKAVDCGPTEYGLVDPNSPPMAIWSHFQRWPPDLFLPRMIEG